MRVMIPTILLLLTANSLRATHAFALTCPSTGTAASTRPSPLFASDDDKKVEVGSKEYLEGFISSPIQDTSIPERGDGVEQGMKYTLPTK